MCQFAEKVTFFGKHFDVVPEILIEQEENF